MFTDHAPVKSKLNTKHPSGKLAFWAESVAELDVEIKFRLGRKNSNADALSRSPQENHLSEEEPELQVAAVTAEEAPQSVPDENSKIIEDP